MQINFERDEASRRFEYPSLKKSLPQAPKKPSEAALRKLQVRREIEWRQECKAAGIDYSSV